MTARLCVALIWPDDDGWRKALPECDGTGENIEDDIPPNLTPGSMATLRERALKLMARPVCQTALKEDFWRLAGTLRQKIIWEQHKNDIRLINLAMELMRQNQKAAAE